MSRPKLDGHIQLSVLVPGKVYHQLHVLRVARTERGAKLPSVGQLIREALAEYVTSNKTTLGGRKRSGEAR